MRIAVINDEDIFYSSCLKPIIFEFFLNPKKRRKYYVLIYECKIV